ncbi:peptidyl-prolyl cis-trans isomerase [Fragilaria crotonensis]|nr:peptidyl-prolyl cis-trans isomerase [Fragilaria crotonensis]
MLESLILLWMLHSSFGFAPSAILQSSTTSTTRSTKGTRLFSSPGLIKTISKEGTGAPLKRGDVATVKYSVYLPDSSPFARSERQRVTVGGGDMIDGWEEAIKTMRVGERAIVRITDPNLGYGAAGFAPVVPPNAVIELDLEVLDAKARSAIDFDTLAIGDPDTPRTAESIAAAYDSLMEKKALTPKKEGLEGWIETVKGWYFFGFFEGETGEEAPWILKPSITFPIAFAIVGAAFLVSYKFGAITERGSQSTDELDDIILSMIQSDPASAAVLATAFAGFVTASNLAAM